LQSQTHAMLRTAARALNTRTTGLRRATATPLLLRARSNQNNHRQRQQNHNNTGFNQTLLAATAGVANVKIYDDQESETENTKLTDAEKVTKSQKEHYIKWISSGKFTFKNFDFKLKDVWHRTHVLQLMSLSAQFSQQIYQAAEQCITSHTTKDVCLDPAFFMMLLWRGSNDAEKLLATAAKNPYTKELVDVALNKETIPSEYEFYNFRDLHMTLHRHYHDMVSAVAKWESIVEAARSQKD